MSEQLLDHYLDLYRLNCASGIALALLTGTEICNQCPAGDIGAAAILRAQSHWFIPLTVSNEGLTHSSISGDWCVRMPRRGCVEVNLEWHLRPSKILKRCQMRFDKPECMDPKH